MLWSKIWFFLVAVVAAVGLTLALVMPRPAERATLANDRKRLTRACGIADILLRDSARNRIQLAGEFSRAAGLDDVLFNASKGEIVSGDAHSSAKTLLQSLNVKGSESLAKRLDVALLDREGRVVARSGKKAQDFGDSLAGYFLVDDALDGYLRDDLWSEGGSLYMVAGSPVVTRQLDWAGAVVVRELIDKDLADELAKQLDAHVSFYVAGEAVATSNPESIHKEVLAHFAELPAVEPGTDCASHEPFTVDAGDRSYWVQISRLPGEAGALGAFFAVFAAQETAVGFAGTIKAVKKDDLSFGTFPWLRLGGLFLLIVLVGIGLTILESDKPLRQLGGDAVRLAKGETERLEEDRHRGKFGSIARSVNIAIDKVHREARSAKKDLDNLLGPMPGEGGGATPLPSSGPKGEPSMPFTPPPPSEFKFGSNQQHAAGAAGGLPPSVAEIDFDIPAPPPPIRPPGGTPTPRPAAALAAATNERVIPPPITLPPGRAAPIPPSVPLVPSSSKTPRPQALSAQPAAPVRPRPAIPSPSPFSDKDGSSPGGPANDTGAGRPVRNTQVIAMDDGETEDEDTRVAPGVSAFTAEDSEASYFRDVFSEFVALKKQCGESIENLTFTKFSRKLAANRDALIEKHGCKTVRFQVYVRDGKAALKASPVRA